MSTFEKSDHVITEIKVMAATEGHQEENIKQEKLLKDHLCWTQKNFEEVNWSNMKDVD